MRFELYTDAALARDIPEHRLRQGDVVKIVDHHPSSNGESGYSIEVFNAIGETIAVTAVPESALESLRKDEVLSRARTGGAINPEMRQQLARLHSNEQPFKKRTDSRPRPATAICTERPLSFYRDSRVGVRRVQPLRQRWREPTLRRDGDVLGRVAGHRIWEFREAASCESNAWDARHRTRRDRESLG